MGDIADWMTEQAMTDAEPWLGGGGHRVSRNLSRSKDGRTIHRADCRYARVPWLWAELASDDELLKAKLAMGYSVCKVCKPDFRVAAVIG